MIDHEIPVGGVLAHYAVVVPHDLRFGLRIESGNKAGSATHGLTLRLFRWGLEFPRRESPQEFAPLARRWARASEATCVAVHIPAYKGSKGKAFAAYSVAIQGFQEAQGPSLNHSDPP